MAIVTEIGLDNLVSFLSSSLPGLNITANHQIPGKDGPYPTLAVCINSAEYQKQFPYQVSLTGHDLSEKWGEEILDIRMEVMHNNKQARKVLINQLYALQNPFIFTNGTQVVFDDFKHLDVDEVVKQGIWLTEIPVKTYTGITLQTYVDLMDNINIFLEAQYDNLH